MMTVPLFRGATIPEAQGPTIPLSGSDWSYDFQKLNESLEIFCRCMNGCQRQPFFHLSTLEHAD